MRGWSITQWIVAVIVIAGATAIMWIAIGAMGITVPSFVVNMMWVVAIVIVSIIAIGVLTMVWRSWFGGDPPSP